MSTRVINHTALLASAALLLGACATREEPAVNPNILPSNYKADVIESVRFSVDDPTNIRDAYIAEPALKPSGAETRYVVCLRYNAKNKDGEYAGSKERAAFFYVGRLTTIAAATREQCGTAVYQPFPELEKLCRELVCPTGR